MAPGVRIPPSPPSSPSPFAIRREMIEIRAWTADFAQLVAAENAPNRGFGRFVARFIRRNQIRGHDETGRTTWNSAITVEQVDIVGNQP